MQFAKKCMHYSFQICSKRHYSVKETFIGYKLNSVAKMDCPCTWL